MVLVGTQAADMEDIPEAGTEEARAADTEEEGVVVIDAANVVIMEGVGGVALMKRPWKKGTDHHVKSSNDKPVEGVERPKGAKFKFKKQECNCLARLGSQQDEDLIVTTNATREFVLVDTLGVGHLRTYFNLIVLASDCLVSCNAMLTLCRGSSFVA
ncbi:hypothetical protein RHMOL_Rhmol06G0236300 [Rhododendron molle]|uniref:Uncharacterized protein n=1 Tax=Rhododendron molle TaxID=49168 RepID=A0ACC0NFU3_RHOML|nr:hypothetical protein RHMOL_Rhmol06G0236300 [Rhododendron molle]